MDYKGESGADLTICNEHVRGWKKKGGKVIGYFCSYVPYEVIIAAGMLPIRIRATGSRDSELGDVYLSPFNCSFARHCLSLGFSGAYDFLDGLVGLNSCDHTRRTYEIWREKIELPFFHFMNLPFRVSDDSINWYKEEIAILIEKLNKDFGLNIPDDALRNAIRLCNDTRRLLHRLYKERNGNPGLVPGSQVLKLLVMAESMPKEAFNEHLKGFLLKASKGEAPKRVKPRIMLIGSVLDDPAFIEIMEDLGADVVMDNLCFGARSFFSLVSEDVKPLNALAARYIGHVPHCPRMCGTYEERLNFVVDMVREFRVDGVVCQRVRMCDCWGGDCFMLSKDLKQRGIPVLNIEREYIMDNIGQIKTRIQAFLEMLGS
jgi:bzd-type benzoyl-CoA reductase N subunit